MNHSVEIDMRSNMKNGKWKYNSYDLSYFMIILSITWLLLSRKFGKYEEINLVVYVNR